MQDFHHCRAGDIVWDFLQLGAGGDLLGWEVFWGVLREIGKRHRSRFCVKSRVANGMIRSSAFYS